MKEMVKMLALETTDVTGSVALCERGEVVAVKQLPLEQRSARSLAPAIDEILNENSWNPSDVDVVAVTVGPGSFTGLRVGIATAKMFAWSIGAQVVGVDVLDSIVAEQDFTADIDASQGALVSVGFDAQRGDVALRNYWTVVDKETNKVKIEALDPDFRIFAIKKWLGEEFAATLEGKSNVSSKYGTAFAVTSQDKLAPEFLERVYFSGPALERVKNRETAYPNVKFAAVKNWKPSAAGVARVAWDRVQRGEFDDVWNLLPVYSRLAAAEERALEKKRLAALESGSN